MYYFLIINLFSFTLMGLDKHKAIKQRYRISELSFFMLAVLGGSIGILLAMMIFHHKTKKLNFVLGIPLILVIQVILMKII